MTKKTIRLKKDGTPWKTRQPRRVKDMGKNRIPSKKEIVASNPPPVEETPEEIPVIKDKVVSIKQEMTLTSEQKALADRLSIDSEKEWEAITEESMVDYSFDKEPYPLPPEAKKLQDEKEFAFRFVLADPQRVDEIRSLEAPLKWWPCNSTNTPYLTYLCDPIHGGIQVKDQILMMKPYWMHQAHQDAKMSLADSKSMAGAIERKDGEKHDWGEYASGSRARVQGGDQQFDRTADGEMISFAASNDPDR